MKNVTLQTLEKLGFMRDGKPSARAIAAAPPKQILDTCEQILDDTSFNNANINNTAFTHAASSSIDCGSTQCASLNCRIVKAKSLAQFSALYSDTVYINNFFVNNFRASTSEYSNEINEKFYNDVATLSVISELLESNNIAMIHYDNVCPHCLFSKHITNTTKSMIDAEKKKITKKFYNDVRFFLLNEYGEITIKCIGPADLLPHHGEIYVSTNNTTADRIITEFPGLVYAAREKGEQVLNKSAAIQLDIADALVPQLFKSIYFELGSANILKTSYLSSSEFEIGIISRLTKDPFTKKRSALMAKYLSCVMPFINNCSAKDLLFIREREQEAFVVFRSAFEKALKEYLKTGEDFNERHAQEIFLEIVQPRLANLDLRVKNASKHVLKSLFTKSLGWVAVLSAGYLSSLITGPILTGAATFAALKTGADAIEELVNKSDNEKEISADDYYFLWKVKEIASANQSFQNSTLAKLL